MFNEINDFEPTEIIELNDSQVNHQNSIDFRSVHISLSSTSEQVETIKNSLQEIPEVNEARVLYFKTEIELGNYQIDSYKIVRKMLNIDSI